MSPQEWGDLPWWLQRTYKVGLISEFSEDNLTEEEQDEMAAASYEEQMAGLGVQVETLDLRVVSD